jgi:membrane-associated phospholipid phosphatase
VVVALLLTEGARRRRRVVAVATALGLGALVAATRALIPFHYLTDVIAGGALGLGVASLAWLGRIAAERRR